MTPSARTMKYIRDAGGICESVERWNPYAGVGGKKRDLFGCIDLVAIIDNQIQFIQATSGGNLRTREKKVLEHKDVLIRIQQAGGKVILYGWRKVKLKRGGVAVRWKPRIIEIPPLSP